MPDVIPTIPQYPEQGIQAELDLVYLWNPNVANELIATLNELLEDLPDYRTVMVYKGSVATVADLPATAKIGDVYNVVETDENFCWTGTAWDNLGSNVDLTLYRTSADQDVIDQGLQDQINLKANAYSVYTKTEANELLAAKQDIINDLQTIRSGAAAGATAVQPGDLATVATSGSYTDLSNTPTLGTAAAENVTAFASAAQGALADTAVQPADISDMETQTHAANTYATQTTVSGLAEDISDIEGLIPEQATTSNQLADKGFVNSSIATNTAYFIGTFRSVSALRAYSEPVTNNDYAFVTNDVVTDNGNDWATFADLDAYNKSLLTMFDYAWVVNGTKFDLYRFEAISQTWVKRATAIDKESVTLNPVFNRYKATVSGGTTTWGYEYTLNNSSFTADQWTAINSGITPEGVALIGTALQPGDNVSELVNDAGYLTTHQSLADLGITATATELNVLDGITADTTELNYVDGVTSNIQTQLNAKQATLVSGTNIKTVNGTSLLGSGDITVSSLPSQTGNAGKFLTTDGTDASWSDKPLVNKATGSGTLVVGDNATDNGCNRVTILGSSATVGSRFFSGSVVIGSNASVMGGGNTVVIGEQAESRGANTVAVGYSAKATAEAAIQLGTGGINSDANTFKVWNNNGNFEIMSADGTVPSDRLKNAINKYSTMPTASASNVGWIVQYTGATDSTYTHGYLYECVSDGADPATYSWERVDVQPAPVIPDPLPSQTGQSGKFLTTNGSSASWSDKPLVNNASDWSIAVGYNTTLSGSSTIIIGARGDGSNAYACTGIGSLTEFGYGTQFATALGNYLRVTASYAIQLGASGSQVTNSDANTFKVANQNGNFEIMSADGTVPADRLKNAINKYSTMPTAASTNEGWIVQYTGATDSTYTHGYLYECVSDGATPTPNYSWTAVQVQASSGGGVSDVTVNGTSVVSGGVAAITGMVQNKSNNSDSSLVWLGNGTATGGTLNGSFNIVFGWGSSITNNNSNQNIIIGTNATISGYNSTGNVLIGRATRITDSYYKNCVLIGYNAWASASNCATINVGGNDTLDYTNSTPNTLKFCNLNGGYEVISANGTIPTDRFTTTPSADGTYVPTLTISSGVATRSWVAPGGGGASSATATLVVNDWSSNTQTVNVTGVTASNNVIVAAAPASQADYTSAGILCTAQGAGTLSFSCQTVPTNAITVNILIL